MSKLRAIASNHVLTLACGHDGRMRAAVCLLRRKLGRSEQQKMEQCEIKNFKMSGNTASYTTVCKGDMQMTADTTITFSGADYKMNMKMAMNQGGQVMNMTQKMDGRYLGPCKK